jgi:hypothetical protein
MKYIEEITPGQCFVYEKTYYILTIDFRSNNQKLCYDLTKGSPRWFLPDTIVELLIQIYTMDEKNTIIPIKETTKENANVSNI